MTQEGQRPARRLRSEAMQLNSNRATTVTLAKTTQRPTPPNAILMDGEDVIREAYVFKAVKKVHARQVNDRSRASFPVLLSFFRQANETLEQSSQEVSKSESP